MPSLYSSVRDARFRYKALVETKKIGRNNSRKNKAKHYKANTYAKEMKKAKQRW